MSYPVLPSDTPTSYVNPNPVPTLEAFGGALVAATVSTVTFVKGHVAVSITNVSGAAPINYTLDGSTPNAGTSPVLDAIAGAHVVIPFDATEVATIKLLSTGVPTYAVVGLDEQELHGDEQVPDTSL